LDQDSFYKIWVNNVDVGHRATDGNPVVTTTNNIQIGIMDTQYQFNGGMDNVMFFNYAIPQEKVNQLYAYGKPKQAINISFDLNQSLPNDSNLTACNSNTRYPNGTNGCYDVNIGSRAMVLTNVIDSNYTWWWFDLNLNNLSSFDTILDYRWWTSFFS